ncbi:hypothetical protein AWENTII_007085 [Aspergillus wentii]
MRSRHIRYGMKVSSCYVTSRNDLHRRLNLSVDRLRIYTRNLNMCAIRYNSATERTPELQHDLVYRKKEEKRNKRIIFAIWRHQRNGQSAPNQDRSTPTDGAGCPDITILGAL